MSSMRWSVAALIAALSLAMPAGAADKPILIDWDDLLPAAERATDPLAGGAPRGIVQHGAIPMTVAPGGLGADPLAEPVELVRDYDDKTVRIAGFVVPFDFDAGVVKEFLLVPYVGACVHVPPPPANQLVFVTSAKGVKIGGLFEPVWITGKFSSAQPLKTGLADVGYQLTVEKVEPYKE